MRKYIEMNTKLAKYFIFSFHGISIGTLFMIFSKKIISVIYFTLFVAISQNVWSQKVRMVTTDWAPYYASTLESGGVVAELVQSALLRGGHESSLSWYSWITAMKMAKNGSADAVMGAYYSEERAEIYNYSEPIFSVDVGLIALKSLGIDKYEGLQSLDPYLISVMRGWVYTQEFDNADFLNKQIVVNQVFAVRMLFAKQVDIVAASISVFKHEANFLTNSKNQDIVVLNPLLDSKPLYLIFSKTIPNSKELVKNFNAGMASIRADGTFQKILDKHGF